MLSSLSPRISLCFSAAAFLLYVGMVRSSTSRRRTCIDTIDDDSLLYIFYHCRPVLLEEDDRENVVLEGGRWERECWWYKLAWVCRRWRHLILASPSYLGISLVCRPGTPVADMLTHSPPLPLIIDYLHVVTNITAEDKEGILLALKHRDRVRRIRLRAFVISLERLVAAIEEGFPMLEYLYIEPMSASDSNWSLPSTFRAPCLRHLVLFYFEFPTGSTLPAGLVTLSLQYINPSVDFSANELLHKLSLMPQLETLGISVYPPLSDQDFEGQLLQIPLSTHVTLPSLRWFMFSSPLAFMESVLPRVTMPFLKVAAIMPSYSPNIAFPIYLPMQFVCKTEHPRFGSVTVTFHNQCVVVTMYPYEGTGMPTLRMREECRDPVAGLIFTIRHLRVMGPVFSEVLSLTLEDKTSFEWHKQYNIRIHWHEFLGFFNKVRTLHIARGDLIEVLSCSLLPEDWESPTGVLPDLAVLSCPKGSRFGELCKSFIAVRRNAGHPVTLARLQTRKRISTVPIHHDRRDE